MTDEVLKLALDALEGFIPYLPLKDEAQCNRYDKAITALRLVIDVQNMASESTYKEQLDCVGWFGYDTGLRLWFEADKNDDGAIPLYKNALEMANRALETKDATVQVSPLEFVEMVMEKEHLIGQPIFWAQWPNKEKNT